VRGRVGEAGSVTGLLVGVVLLLAMVVGLAVDGTRLFVARRDLQRLADSAALAGASSIDEARYRASGGLEVVIDPASARFAAAGVVSTSGWPPDGTGRVEVSGSRVTVALQRPVRLTLLGLAGLGPQTIGATATADPVLG
jgi:uncharacterized membrane protein